MCTEYTHSVRPWWNLVWLQVFKVVWVCESDWVIGAFRELSSSTHVNNKQPTEVFLDAEWPQVNGLLNLIFDLIIETTGNHRASYYRCYIMLRFAVWPASRNKPNLSKIYHKGAHIQLQTDLCCSHSLFVQTCLPLSQDGQGKEQCDTSAVTQSVNCTCSWLFSPCVLVKKKKNREKLRLKDADPQPRIDTPMPGKSVYSTTDCWSCLRQKNNIPVLVVHIWVRFWADFILIPSIKRLNHWSRSCYLPSHRVGIFTASLQWQS